MRGALLQAETRDGRLLLTPAQAAARRAEAENERLRREIARPRGEE